MTVLIIAVLLYVLVILLMTRDMFRWFPLGEPYWWIKYIPMISTTATMFLMACNAPLFAVFTALPAVGAYQLGNYLQSRETEEEPVQQTAQ